MSLESLQCLPGEGDMNAGGLRTTLGVAKFCKSIIFFFNYFLALMLVC